METLTLNRYGHYLVKPNAQIFQFSFMIYTENHYIEINDLIAIHYEKAMNSCVSNEPSLNYIDIAIEELLPPTKGFRTFKVTRASTDDCLKEEMTDKAKTEWYEKRFKVILYDSITDLLMSNMER